MADDQNQQGQQTNTARIQAMLDELARVRAAGKKEDSTGGESRTPSSAPSSATPPPPNLPTAERTAPPPSQAPTTQQPPRPIPPPKPAQPQPPRPIPPPVPQKPAPQQPPKPAPPAPPQPKPAPRPPQQPPKPAPPAPREQAPAPVPKPPQPPTPAPKPEAPSPVTSELRTMEGDIAQIQVGKAPEGTRSAPSPTPAPKASVAPQPKAPARVTVPKESGKKRGKWLLYTAFGFIGVVIIIFILAAVLGGGDAEPTPTPTPVGSFTPAPSVSGLSDYFGDPQATATVDNVNATFTTADPAAGEAIPIAVNRVDGRIAPPNEMLIVLFADTPLDVEAALISENDTEGLLLAFGQTELLDENGQSVTGTERRPVFIAEVEDVSAVNQQMRTWEDAGFVHSTNGPFFMDSSNTSMTEFMEGTYKQIPVRFWNFPYADTSLDWAIVLASNGKNYLVISGSRESMFFTIDRLLQ